MGNLIELNEAPIKPVYWQTYPSEAIHLGSLRVKFAHKSETHSEAATATIRFIPDDRLLFTIPIENKDPFFGVGLVGDDAWDGKLELSERSVTLDVLCTAVGADHAGIVFAPKTSGVTVTPACDDISEAIFHLFNFPDFSGPEDYALKFGEPPRQGSTRCGRVVLRADGWVITIAATRETHDLTKALKASGGYIITHMGKVEREDGSTFSSADLEELLHCLHYFLSFALGRWAGIALPIGFDANRDRVFEQWGMPITAEGSWHGSSSWFDLHHAGLLPDVFPGFMTLWKSSIWHKPLKEGLYWYLGANDRGTGIGVDTGLILAQTALELFAWTYCVQDRKMVSDQAFRPRGLSAADKLRILASSLGIPMVIDTTLSALHGKRGGKWKDGMDAITGIRNLLVHPDRQNELPDGSYYDAWKLSLWYIDLILLRLCGHSGRYANRLVSRWVGVTELVPWASAKP